MDVSPLAGIAIAVAVLIGMEGFAYAAHRWVMHGFMWTWHASHHRDRDGIFEKNDLFALVFASVCIALIYAGTQTDAGTLWAWVGLGVFLYGMVYFIFHDVIVHRRLPHSVIPKSAYFKRIVQAHRLHHVVGTKEGTVSFGFLYAPPIDELVAAMKRNERLRPATASVRAARTAQRAGR